MRGGGTWGRETQVYLEVGGSTPSGLEHLAAPAGVCSQVEGDIRAEGGIRAGGPFDL